MNARLVPGVILDRTVRYFISRPWFPLFRTFLTGREWAYDVSRLAGRRHLPTLFDVGANIGQTSTYLNLFFPTATIHAFEMVPTTADILRHNTRHLRNIEIHPTALASVEAQATLRLQPYDYLNSLLHQVTDDQAQGEYATVEVTTVDHFCSKHGISHIDILKTDTEGGDLDLLRGAERMLQSRRISFVYVEVCFKEDDRHHQYFPPLHEFLFRHGFRFFGLYESSYYGGPLFLSNALYLNEEALAKSPRPS